MQIIEDVRGRLRSVDNGLSRHTWYRIGRNSLLGLNRRDGQRKAAAMTYFAVFSIFPFILLLISLVSFAIDSEEAQARIIDLLSGFLPAGPTGIRSVIEGVIAARGVAAGFGLVLLLWGALGWFESIDRSVNEMWRVADTRPFLKGKLFALAMIAGIALAMWLSWVANIAIDVVRGFAPFIGVAPPGAVWDLAVASISLGFIFLVFLLLYRFSPQCRLQWGDVWRGALVTAFLWEVLRSGFALYVTRLADFSSAYGPLGAVIAFLTWLYLAHLVMLFGAQLTYVTRLEAQGIHRLRDLPCGTREVRPRAPQEEGGPAA